MNSTLCKNRYNYTERNKLPRNPHLSAQPSQNRTILCLALSPLPLNKRFVSFASALSLEKHYILASLVKGRWIDSKAQTVVLLRFNCDTPAFFIHQTFLPSRRRDCHTTPPKTALSLALHHHTCLSCQR